MMRSALGWLAAAIVTIGVSAGPAQAMEIAEFDKMSAADQGRYVGMLLRGAEHFLRDQGKDEIAVRTVKMFGQPGTGDVSPGMYQLEKDLQTARQLTSKSGKAFHVEHSFLVTMAKFKVELPKADVFKFAEGSKPSEKK